MSKQDKGETRQVMYCGPTIPGIFKSNAIFIGGIPNRLQEKSDENKYIKHLIVPVSSITDFKKEVKITGTVENVAYNEISKLVKGE